MVRASAPAKLILAGEWSVLEPHGSAVVLAVDERLVVEARRADAWSVARGAVYHLDDEHDAEGAPQELRFLATVLELARRSRPETALALESLPGGVTAGLGSSAAVVSASVLALYAVRGETPSREELFADAFEAHHRAQKGKGSGCDVAAACYGGLIGYRRRGEELPRITALDLAVLPPLAVAHAGPKASTTALIAALGRAERESPASYRLVIEGLERAAQRVAEALERREATTSVLSALEASAQHLTELDALSGGRLEPPPVRELLDLARAEGATAKISGAGGGDCVLAFADEPARRVCVEEAWARAGYRVLAWQAARSGARLERDEVENLPRRAG